MKKDSFMKGALVATLCIVFSKILGIIYVIPFHAIIGMNGRTLYAYAYNMYQLFLNFSTVGIPLAISKMVSEYNVLGYHDAKKRTYKIAVKITVIVASILTIVLFVFAHVIAKTIIGDLKGGNSVADITFVLRVAASALLIVTILSNLRGYLQGHKYITAPSISQVIEQFIRVIVVVFGSYVAIKLWGTKEAVGVAMSGATIGAIVAFVYLEIKMKKLRNSEKEFKITKEEKELNNKTLFKKLVIYTIPFVVVSIAISLYNSIDVLTIVKPLVKYGHFKVQNAEMILSVISTWGAKLNSIVTSIAAGMVIAVLPNVTSDYVKKDMKSVENKINNTLQIILFFVIPMVAGLSFLAEPVWNIFYDGNRLCINVFRYSICTSLFYSLFLNVYTIMQSVDRQKFANKTIVVGLIIKIILNIPLIILFSKVSLIPAYYGSVSATILAYVIPITMCLVHLNKNLNINLKSTFTSLIKIVLSTLGMIVTLLVLKSIIPLGGTKLYSLIIIAIYSTLGIIVYMLINVKSKNFENTFNCNIKEFIKSKFRRKI